MRRWIGRAVVVAGLLLAAPAGAAPITDYTSFHVLGDSLSDRGKGDVRGDTPEPALLARALLQRPGLG